MNPRRLPSNSPSLAADVEWRSTPLPIDPPVVSATPDPGTLAACVLRHWLSAILLATLTGVLGSGAAYIVIAAKYKATAMVRLAGPSGLIEKPNESSNAQREFRSTQQEILRMPHVLKFALEQPDVRDLDILDVDPDSIDELNGWLVLELPRSSEILRISVQHERADVAQTLANAVTTAYLYEVRHQKEEDLDKRLKALDKLHSDTDARLAEAWTNLQQLARQLGAGDPAALSIQVQAEIENYRAYSRRLREIRAERREAERVVKAIEENSDTLNKEMPEDASMHSVKYAMFQARLKKEAALRKWGEKHPDVLAAQQEEDLLKEFYQKSAAEQPSPAQPKDRKSEMLAEPLSTIARLTNEEQALTELVKEIDERMELIGGDAAAKLEILRNDINRMEKLSDRLWQTRESLQVERHADQRVQLVATASKPQQRDESKRKKLTIMAGGGGFGFVLFVVAVLEFLTGRLHSPRELERRTGVPVVAHLPKLPASLSARTTLSSHSQTKPLRSQLDLFVASLVHHPLANDAQVFLVSSASNNEERANVALHLAGTLARSGQRTVLLNLDFREPTSDGDAFFDGLTVARLLANGPDESADETWHDYLDRVDCRTQLEGLDYLPAGAADRSPLAILMNPRLKSLLAALRERYVFIVLDAPPVLEFPDAVHAGCLADVAVLAAIRNQSRAGSINQARSRLNAINLPVVGTLIA